MEKGHWTVHKAAMLLGPLMVLSGLSSLLGTLFAPLHFLIEIYIMCAGVVSLALETSAYAQNKYLLCLKVYRVSSVSTLDSPGFCSLLLRLHYL